MLRSSKNAERYATAAIYVLFLVIVLIPLELKFSTYFVGLSLVFAFLSRLSEPKGADAPAALSLAAATSSPTVQPEPTRPAPPASAPSAPTVQPEPTAARRRPRTSCRPAPRHLILLLPLVLIALDLIGCLYSTNLNKVGGVFERHLSYLALPIIFSCIPLKYLKEGLFKKFFYIIIISASVMVLNDLLSCTLCFFRPGTISQIYRNSGLIDAVRELYVSPVYYINRYIYKVYFQTSQSYFLLSALLFMAYIVLFKKSWFRKKREKTFLVVSFFLILLGLVLMPSKIGYLSLGVLLILLFVILLKRKKYKIVYFALALLLICFAATRLVSKERNKNTKASVLVIKEALQGDVVHQDGSVKPRLRLWTNAISAIKERPLFGYGIAGEHYAMNKHKNASSLQALPSEISTNTHNFFLLIMLRHGILGFALYFATLIIPIIYSIRKRQYILAVFVLLTMVFAFTEILILQGTDALFFIFAFSMLYAYIQREV